jgi:hypothetical protein
MRLKNKLATALAFVVFLSGFSYSIPLYPQV